MAVTFSLPVMASSAFKILVIHSYHQEYPWTKRQHEGFMEALNEDEKQLVTVMTEYLNTKMHAFDAKYQQFFADYLKEKYDEKFVPDLIYVTDDNALTFVLNHSQRLFPKAKIIFSGINDVNQANKLERTKFTGIIEKKSLKENIDLIRIYEPRLEEILILGDGSHTYEMTKKELISLFETDNRVKLHFICSPQIDETIAKLDEYDNRFVLLTTIGQFKNNEGETLLIKEVLQKLQESSKRRIFVTMEDSYMFSGVIGGYMTSGHEQGYHAGEMAKSYIKKGVISAIPILFDSPNRYIFDQHELEKAKLYIPAEIQYSAIVYNDENDLYHIDTKWLLGMIFILVMVLTIVLFRRCPKPTK